MLAMSHNRVSPFDNGKVFLAIRPLTSYNVLMQRGWNHLGWMLGVWHM